MNCRIFEYVLAVAETGSVTQAARRCYAHPSTLSKQLRALEARLGVTLFERETGDLRLTAAGHVLLPRIRAIVALVAQLQQEAISIR